MVMGAREGRRTNSRGGSCWCRRGRGSVLPVEDESLKASRPLRLFGLPIHGADFAAKPPDRPVLKPLAILIRQSG